MSKKQSFSWLDWALEPFKNFTPLQGALLAFGWLVTCAGLSAMFAFVLTWRGYMTMEGFGVYQSFYLTLVAAYTLGSVARHRNIALGQRRSWRFELMTILWAMFTILFGLMRGFSVLGWIRLVTEEQFDGLTHLCTILLIIYGAGYYAKHGKSR